MTSTKNNILVDTNILVYSTDSSSAHHAESVAYMKSNYTGLVLCNQNVNEYIRVVTHAKFIQPLKTEEALKNIEAIKKSFYSFVLPTDRTHKVFVELLKKYKVVANQVFDTYLVAIALSNSINSIVTFNGNDFDKFKEINIITP